MKQKTENTIEYKKEQTLKIPVEVYSRVSGYFRPVSQWNKGKQEEFRERKYYSSMLRVRAVRAF